MMKATRELQSKYETNTETTYQRLLVIRIDIQTFKSKMTASKQLHRTKA